MKCEVFYFPPASASPPSSPSRGHIYQQFQKGLHSQSTVAVRMIPNIVLPSSVWWMVPFQSSNLSRSSARIDCTSGKRGVIMQSCGGGRLHTTIHERPKQICSEEYPPNDANVHNRTCIWRHFLPVLVLHALENCCPQDPCCMYKQ